MQHHETSDNLTCEMQYHISLLPVTQTCSHCIYYYMQVLKKATSHMWSVTLDVTRYEKGDFTQMHSTNLDQL